MYDAGLKWFSLMLGCLNQSKGLPFALLEDLHVHIAVSLSEWILELEYWSTEWILNEYCWVLVEYWWIFAGAGVALFSLFALLFHMDALLCHLCDFANVSFVHFVSLACTSVHFCVTCVRFSALQILLAVKFESTSALCTFCQRSAQTRFKLMSNWFELIWNFKTPRRHHRDTAGWLSGAFGLKTRFQKSCPRFARKRSEE